MTKIILFLLGIIASVAGIVSASVTASWSAASIMLLALGVILLLSSLWLWGNKHKFWQRRSTKKNAGGLVTITLILLVIGLINLGAIATNIRWDLTENRLFTLSEQSQAIIAQLEQPLEVLIFDRNINPELENLLENYRRQSLQFTYRYINPEQEIGLAQKFGVESLGEIYLRYGDKRQRVDRSNIARGETLTETQLINGIEKIKRDRPTNIYLLQGHGESSLEFVEGGLAQAVRSLEAKGNTVKPLNLASSKTIPEDANLIAIAGATRKLLPAEVTSLQEYLQRGNLLLLLSPNTDLGIDALLTAWGIELDNRLVVDGSGAATEMGFGPAVAIVNEYGEHPITASFGNGITIFPESRPLKIQPKSAIESATLVTTSQQTWAESDLSSEEITFDSAQDLPGGLNVAIALSQSQTQSRLVVFGSSTFITNGWFEQQLNSDLFLNAVNWLVGEDRDTLAIRPKEAANRRINLSLWQSSLISWLAVRIMPFSAFVTGVLVWRKRR